MAKYSEAQIALLLNRLAGRTNDNTQRLRDIEQRLKLIEARILEFEDAAAVVKKDMGKSAAETNGRIKGVSDKMAVLEAKVNEIVAQLKKTVDKSELYAIKELLDLYSPLKSKFITREEAETMIEKSR